MNTDTIKRLLTVLSSAVKIERGQLYQLVQSAEASYCLRDVHAQNEIGLALQSFAYPFNQVGKYYESVFLYRTGQLERAKQLLECVAESAPARYRSKALLSLSAVEESLGCFEESLRLRSRASTCNDLVTLFEAQRGIAVLRGMEGDHRAALHDLERLMPLAHVIGKRGHPSYFAFLNSYALELCEGGRVDEAEQVGNVVAASPFIGRYLEWQETVSEIATRRKRSSVVAVAYPSFESRVIHDSRVRAAIDFMKANMQRRVTLTEVARAVNISITHISHLFQKEVRTSPIEYLIGLRIEKAQELLATSSLSIKEIMAAVGYSPSNRNGFGRQFKRYSMLTPTAYRRRARMRH